MNHCGGRIVCELEFHWPGGHRVRGQPGRQPEQTDNEATYTHHFASSTDIIPYTALGIRYNV
jgi:hypothetical protein